MAFRPGTVSKILWHFTGGPLWDDANNKQLSELKSAVSGYDALKAIIASSQLRVGRYHEVIKVIVPQKRKYDFDTKKFTTLINYPVTVKSKPVCCVADIPLQHIGYHSSRYGKIAIGFHRDSIIKARFNPVMYTLENTALLNSIYQGYSAIDDVDPSCALSEVESTQIEIDSVLGTKGLGEEVDTSNITTELDWIESAYNKIDESYQHFLAHIKTFDPNEFDTIYCEREWRSTENFDFTLGDIAIIVLPREQEGILFYKRFLDEVELPRTVTVACWEDLVEH